MHDEERCGAGVGEELQGGESKGTSRCLEADAFRGAGLRACPSVKGVDRDVRREQMSLQERNKQ